MCGLLCVGGRAGVGHLKDLAHGRCSDEQVESDLKGTQPEVIGAI